MARQANGTYIQPANTAAVSGQAISSTAFNTLITDVGTEITNSLDRQGRSAMQAALPMGSNKITGMADPTVATDGATKNYVDSAVGSFFSTGDIKPTLKTAPDTGWILMDDGTFGSASSGSSNRANADTQALFNLLFANLSDTAAPLLTSGGGATTRAAQTNAATAWAANCRMTLPKSVARVFGNAANGSGIASRYSPPLSARTLGQSIGEEVHTLTLSEIPTGLTVNGTVSVTSTGNVIGQNSTATMVDFFPSGGSGARAFSGSTASAGTVTSSGTNTLTSNNTGGVAHNNIQPTVFVNWMVKL